MEGLLAKISSDPAIEKIKKFFATKGQKGMESHIYGLSGTQKRAALAACLESMANPLVIITHGRENAAEWADDLSELLSQKYAVYQLPLADMAFFSTSAKSLEVTAQRLEILGKMSQGGPMVVVAQGEAAVQKELARNDVEAYSLTIKRGAQLSMEIISERLVKMGYERTGQIEHLGQFCVRGGIIDIYPINAEAPYRLELLDDEIESIRTFDINSQISVAEEEAILVMPLLSAKEIRHADSFLAYLPEEASVCIDEPNRVHEEILAQVKENPEYKDYVFKWEELLAQAKKKNVVYMSLMLQRIHTGSPKEIFSITAKNMTSFQRQMELLTNELKEWQKNDYAVAIIMEDEQKADYIKGILASHDVEAALSKRFQYDAGTIALLTGSLMNGFEMPGAKLAVITEKDIMGHQKRHLLRQRAIAASPGEKINHFSEIKVGDYVVHINHGIGKYMGVETIDLNGIHRDYLHIKYSGNDKLFVPTDQVHLLQKYIGSEGEAPQLSKMNGTAWKKAKKKAQEAVEKIATELIELYAQRKAGNGFKFSPDTPWQHEFEESFPYEETDDQLMALREIKDDMESEKAMDRLLCGDVGFGKTEVAIRAAFKAVMDGKQVAVLVPTTVLAQQHYKTFSNRMAEFAPVVDVICRFRTAKEQKSVLEKLALGQVDILIGTHAILNKSVKYKDLGLLIVDEEQRFGVKQKEKIKRLSTNLDVLTLSATPIPRTLHMSLVGARDMSVIETPPKNRYPIQTYVVENQDNIICDAIRRELRRGGQVYFVYNRVNTIDKMYLRLSSLLPEVKIKVAHGQMPEGMLEDAMMEFYEGKYDVLLATSIIENGLDIANANTIIIYDADNFGLSQLYQMRGRVGRSNNMAFAYFVYQRDKVLTETAEKRLQAIKDFAQLGSGFKIAMRDLEIRGAGNLLGSQQHGHIASVGFEMYCHLLEEAVEKLSRGNKARVEPLAEPTIEIKADAYIDADYIDDAMHKIEIYQRIAAIRTKEHIKALKDELEDRFGQLTEPLKNLLQIAEVKNYARDLGIKSISEQAGVLIFALLKEHKLKTENIFRLRNLFGGLIRFISGNENIIQVKMTPNMLKKPSEAALRVVKTLAGEQMELKRRK